MDIEIVLASADFSSMVNPAIVIYLLESIDGGTDYDTSSDAEKRSSVRSNTALEPRSVS